MAKTDTLLSPLILQGIEDILNEAVLKDCATPQAPHDTNKSSPTMLINTTNILPPNIPQPPPLGPQHANLNPPPFVPPTGQDTEPLVPNPVPRDPYDDCTVMELRHQLSYNQLPPWEFPGMNESEFMIQKRAEELSKLSINAQLHFAEIHDLFALAMHGIRLFRAPGPTTVDKHHKNCGFRMSLAYSINITLQLLAVAVTKWQSNPDWVNVHIPWPNAIDDFQWYCHHLTTEQSGVSQ